jgi:hypothetical protein
MKRIACNGLGFVLALAVVGIPAAAHGQASSEPQGSSLGDYARNVRKTPGAANKAKVFDNDNLPKDEKLSIVGPAAADNATETKSDESAPAAAGESKATADANDPAKGEAKSEAKAEGKTESKESKGESKDEKSAAKPAGKTPEEEQAQKQAAWKQWGDRIASQKEQIDLADRELNVLQREYQIRAAAMYSDAGNRLRNSSNWDQTDAQYKQQIADKQKQLDDAKQKLDDIQEEARKAGVPASVREP